MQNSCVDNISSQLLDHEDWTEFVQNFDTSSAGVQSNKLVTNCQNNIATADVDNQDNVKYESDGWCEIDKCPSGVTDTPVP